MSPHSLPHLAQDLRAPRPCLNFGHQGMRSGQAVPSPEAFGPTPARPIHRLSADLQQRFGHKLRRIMLDLGLSCPNRDGTTGHGGCIYCDVHGSGTGAAAGGASLDEQWTRELARVRRTVPTGPCGILYFQSYSNTWPDLEPLAQALAWAATHAEIAPILAVGTRPDCFTEAAADLIAQYRSSFAEVWMEFGLETADDEVQKRIGRHDTLAAFHQACTLAGERGLLRVAHTIHGLPGEGPEGWLRQVAEITRAGCEGIKFHQLIVLRRTILARQWLNDEIQLASAEEYGDAVAEALARLPWSVVVHRLCADARAADRLDGRDAEWNRSAERRMLDTLQKSGEASRIRTCD